MRIIQEIVGWMSNSADSDLMRFLWSGRTLFAQASQGIVVGNWGHVLRFLLS